ncbi:hypothetical protein MTO96_038282 [Rhipicephalus appendiculatus]
MGAARKVALWQEHHRAECADAGRENGQALAQILVAAVLRQPQAEEEKIERERTRTGGGRLGGVEGRILAILDRTAPDSAPVRLFTGENEDNSAPRPVEAAAAVAVPMRPAPMPQPFPALRPAPPLQSATAPQPAPTAHVSVGEPAGHQRHCT